MDGDQEVEQRQRLQTKRGLREARAPLHTHDSIASDAHSHVSRGILLARDNEQKMLPMSRDLTRSRSSSGSTEKEVAAVDHVPLHVYGNACGLALRARLVQPCSSDALPASASQDADSPSLTFSLHPLPAAGQLLLTLLKADHLARSHTRPVSGVRANFVAEGLIARIYKRERWLQGRESEESVLETPVITAGESTSIEFPTQVIALHDTDFPVRISLYDVDRNRVRVSLGHTLLGIQEPSAAGEPPVTRTQRLWPTVCSATQQHASSQ